MGGKIVKWLQNGKITAHSPYEVAKLSCICCEKKRLFKLFRFIQMTVTCPDHFRISHVKLIENASDLKTKFKHKGKI